MYPTDPTDTKPRATSINPIVLCDAMDSSEAPRRHCQELSNVRDRIVPLPGELASAGDGHALVHFFCPSTHSATHARGCPCASTFSSFG
jgi:hypothetical protein